MLAYVSFFLGLQRDRLLRVTVLVVGAIVGRAAVGSICFGLNEEFDRADQRR
jgi:hypothetical protein